MKTKKAGKSRFGLLAIVIIFITIVDTTYVNEKYMEAYVEQTLTYAVDSKIESKIQEAIIKISSESNEEIQVLREENEQLKQSATAMKTELQRIKEENIKVFEEKMANERSKLEDKIQNELSAKMANERSKLKGEIANERSKLKEKIQNELSAKMANERNTLQSKMADERNTLQSKIQKEMDATNKIVANLYQLHTHGLVGGLALLPFKSSSYVLSITTKNWAAARASCRGLGGDLAAFEEDSEWDHVHAEGGFEDLAENLWHLKY